MKKTSLLSVLLLASAAFALGAPPASTGVEKIRADVEFLASDALHGRRAGTADADAAAEFVADSFRKIGLLPAGVRGTYFQKFEFIDGVDLGKGNALTVAAGGEVGRVLRAGEDFRPLGFSSPGSVDGVVVFAGYGIASKERGWDDYDGLDVKDKVVLVLRYGPDGDDPKSDFSPFSALRYKASVAREKGAKALLVVTGPATKDVRDELVAARTDASFSDSGIVAFSIKRAVGEALFSASGKTLEEAQRAIDHARKPASFALPKARVTAVADLTPHRVTTSNVIGVLPGMDASVNTETLVVGAHYDHLGLGGPSSLEPGPPGKIHHGADDNASGVAALLELAREAIAKRSAFRRSVLFIAFGAEEEGTLGSLHFVKSPTIPLEKVVGMVNLDMVGRLHGDALDVHGVGTSPVWKPLVEKANAAAGFKLRFHEGGFGPSDHSSFYAAEKPVLFLFTGVHTDYHRASDTADKIDANGIERIVSFLEPVVEGVAGAPARPDFTRVKGDSAAPSSSSAGLRVYFGTIPDYSEETAGLKLTGVSPGSPAEKAGLKGGDRIVRFGEKEIRNIYDYTYALGDHRPGDKVTVVVERNENGVTVRKSLEAVLGARASSAK